MAFANITFQNPTTGVTRIAPVGISWTVFFFDFLPPMFRSDWKWAIIMFTIASMTFGLSAGVFVFIYNKIYIKELINNGFRAKFVIAKKPGKRITIDLISQKLGFNIPTL